MKMQDPNKERLFLILIMLFTLTLFSYAMKAVKSITSEDSFMARNERIINNSPFIRNLK